MAESLQVLQMFGRKNISDGSFLDQEVLPVFEPSDDGNSGYSLQTPKKLLKMDDENGTIISIRIPSLHNTELAALVVSYLPDYYIASWFLLI